jgi:WD40 repeat protein
MTDDDLTPVDAEESEFCAFIESYEAAQAAGKPLPSPDALSPPLRARWQRTRGLLDLLDRVGPVTLVSPPQCPPRPIRNEPAKNDLGHVGPYRLLRELGRGGMGVVYLAHDPQLHRDVAVKILPPTVGEQPARLSRFDAERRLLARQRHPNIVQVYEAGEDQGRPYLVMEYVTGPSLRSHLDGRPLEPRAAATLLELVARAVEHAHRQKIIHRDLKPANILLQDSDVHSGRLDCPKVSDFGLATTLEHTIDLTRTGELLGTPVYMAPEMASAVGERGGPTVDVYGLGAILYECLTGRPPFVGVNPVFVLAQVQHAEPVRPRHIHPEVPADLDTICLKCLEKQPRKRYPTAQALADDLRCFLDGRPIQARPASAVERATKFVRRYPALSAAWTISAAALIAFVIVLLVSSVRLKDERDKARAQEQDATWAKGEAVKARGRAEELLLDLNVTLGQSAEKTGNLPDAALWFAVAARQAPADSEQAKINRLRWQTFTAASPVPWRAVQVPTPERLTWLGLHASNRWAIAAVKNTTWTLWDLDWEVNHPWPGPARTVRGAAWSHDGRYLATGAEDGSMHIFTFPEGELIAQEQVKGPVQCLTFDPSDRFLAFADGEHCLQVRRPERALPLVLQVPHPDELVGIGFSPSGKRVATFCNNNTASVFALDAPEGKPPLLLGPVPQRLTRGCYPTREGPGFLSDDVVVTCDLVAISVWDLTTGKCLKQFPGGAYELCGTGVSAAGQYIVVWRHFQEPEVWQVSDERAAVDRAVRSPPAEDVAIRPDGSSFLLGLKNGFQLWNRDRSPASALLWHHSLPNPLVWSADGNWFVTGGDKGSVRLWRAQPDRPLSARLPTAGRHLPLMVTPSPDGASVVTSTEKDGAEFQVYALVNGVARGLAMHLPGRPTAAVFSPDGQIIYAVSVEEQRGWLGAWKWATGQPVFSALEVPFDPYDVACRPDGAVLVLAGGQGNVELRTAATGAVIHQERAAGSFDVPMFICDRIRFAPDGRSFVTWGRQNRVCQWDARTGTPVRVLTAAGLGRCVDARFSPQGRYLAAASTISRHAVVWDLATGRLAAAPLVHPDFVFSACFDATGERLLTTCRDGKTRAWHWRTGQHALPEMAQEEEVTDAIFSPDGKWIASGEAGGKLRLWDPQRGLPLTPGWLLQSPGQPPAYFANRLEFSADGRFLLAGVRGRQLLVFDLSRATMPLRAALTAEDLVLLAEINAGKMLLPGGTVEPLSTAHWFARWQEFRRRNPTFHAFAE